MTSQQTAWVEHSDAADEMGLSQQAAYETHDSPLRELERQTRERLDYWAEREPCGRCAMARPRTELLVVEMPAASGGVVNVKACADCRRRLLDERRTSDEQDDRDTRGD